MIRHVVDYGFMSFAGRNLDEQIQMVRDFVFATRYRNVMGNRDFLVWRAGMDTGGGKKADEDITMTTRAYTIIRKASDGKRLVGTKGRSTTSAAKMTLSQVDKMPGKQGKIIPGGLNIWMVNTDAFKDAASYYLGLEVGSLGAIQFHRDVQRDLAEHLSAEEKRKNRKGQWEWVQTGTHNHLLDCLVGALALGDRECWGGVEALHNPQCVSISNSSSGESIRKQQRPALGRRVISRGVE
jgi:phage terminase large subunit GpA-like protein